MIELIEDSNKPKNVSIATFKPSRIIGFEFKEEREWSEMFKKNIQQKNLFSEKGGRGDMDTVRKLPFKFYYKFEDKNGSTSRMMIEDWEIGALFWKCLNRADGDENIALQKVKEMYFNTFTEKNDIYLFLGTTAEYHRRRMKNPFVIIGVFYPPKNPQTNQKSLF